MPDTAISNAEPKTVSNAFRFAQAVYIPASGLIRTSTGSIRLEPKLSRLLDLFIDAAGASLSREEILDAVWPESGSDEALTQAVSRLRRHLGAHAIKTLPRYGYALAQLPEPTSLALDENDDAATARPLRLRARWPLKSMLIFSAGLASGLGLAVLFAPLLFVQQVEIEEIVGAPGDETRLIRTSAECSLLTQDCARDDGS